MAWLEYIRYQFFTPSLSEQGQLVWARQAKKPISALPQIYWKDGCGWDVANVWSLSNAANKPPTLKRKMKHVCRYANFLEKTGNDWHHFPVRKDEQVLRKFRKHLIDEVEDGLLAGSTATNCMSAVIQLYRFVDAHGLLRTNGPMWTDRAVTIPYHDSAGFKRSLVRLTNDLRIPNRKRVGVTLEDGLLPLRHEHMSQLLAYMADHELEELHQMLNTGFFSGARVGTVTTLTVSCLDTAREDPLIPGIYLLPVGPGTDVATKFSVAGDLVFPKAVLDDLKRYAYSARRLLREAKAQRCDKNLLFLTRRGRPYTVDTVNRLVYEMRARAVAHGLPFMQRFRFHQSRATFGTWMLELLLKSGVSSSAAIDFVRGAMLHRDEATTLRYIKFREVTRGKQEVATAFSAAFAGVGSRNWDNVYA
ncbi:site-specific integrase [Burkholderia pseudomallei]|nr:site-specific integrase [Burkholderia pseudomallei]